MTTNNWKKYFGENATAPQIIKAAEESNITLPDYLAATYVEIYGETDEQIDFDNMGEQVWDDARSEIRSRIEDMDFSDEQLEFIFGDWTEGDEHFTWLATASKAEITSWGVSGDWGKEEEKTDF